ncbi:hypothetical protein ColTof4_01230 [Colletotrichum tofieldiae]|nr:hypothetical protein ColTof4_01230 [Colletotrichum tofieldiae]
MVESNCDDHQSGGKVGDRLSQSDEVNEDGYEWASVALRQRLRVPTGALKASPIQVGASKALLNSTLGDREKQNLFTAELAAIHRALEALPESLRYGNIAILSRNKTAVLAASKPRQQSGQADMQRIYEKASKLRKAGNTVSIGWITPDADPELMQAAKRAAQRSANPSSPPTKRPYRAASTTLAIAVRNQKHTWTIPAGVGKYSKRIDAALLGKHTRELYDPLTAAQAKVLAQLRTGMTRLNGYLHKIKAVPSGTCPCGQAEETVEHFLFRCTKWDQQRRELQQKTGQRTGNLPFHLGGKSRTDAHDWKPCMEAVQATIRYALATGRLDERA